MDDKRFQQMEKRLNEQAEATRAMNETLNKLSNLEVAKASHRLPQMHCNL
jgi:hypothetical protein